MTASRRFFLQSISGATVATPYSGQIAYSTGMQRLSLGKLKAWEELGYGMFVHFGLSTFLANEYPDGTAPASVYAPDRLDVDQWVQIALDAGMKYAVLTAKHHAGHCLWPSRYTDYAVQASGNKTDVVAAFVQACERRGILAGIYYASDDRHHLFGRPRSLPAGQEPFTTSLYQDFQTGQLTELLMNYGPIGEVWIDIPKILGSGYRTFLYGYLATLQSDTIIVMNNGVHDGRAGRFDRSWPTDAITMERMLPPVSSYQQWREIEGKLYYVPCEVCDTLGQHWFWMEDDRPRLDEELLRLLVETRTRKANLLLDVGPDKHGQIPLEYKEALLRLRKNARL